MSTPQYVFDATILPALRRRVRYGGRKGRRAAARLLRAEFYSELFDRYVATERLRAQRVPSQLTPAEVTRVLGELAEEWKEAGLFQPEVEARMDPNTPNRIVWNVKP